MRTAWGLLVLTMLARAAGEAAARGIRSARGTFLAEVQREAADVAHVQLFHGDATVSWAQAAALWADGDEEWTTFCTRLLQTAVPWTAYFWETPPFNHETFAAQPFQWVLVRASALEGVSADTESFAEHFARGRGGGVLTFPNLGGDSMLVVPEANEQGGEDAYAHLKAFVDGAAAAQVQQLWRTLGEAVQKRVKERPDAPVWVSTSGLGVYWLHVRLDLRPKYYQYRPFTRFPPPMIRVVPPKRPATSTIA